MKLNKKIISVLSVSLLSVSLLNVTGYAEKEVLVDKTGTVDDKSKISGVYYTSEYEMDSTEKKPSRNKGSSQNSVGDN